MPLTFTGPAIPIGGDQPADSPTPAASLQGAVAYGATQDPDQYAHLLDLQKKLGLPPAVSAGNEKQVQQAADVNSIDYPRFAASNPRTTAWASNPDNAAVSGASEVQRLGGIEQNAAAMRAVPQAERTSNPLRDFKDAFVDALTHPLETVTGADTPQAAAAKQASVSQAADQTGDPFLRSSLALQEYARKPLLGVSGTGAFRSVFDPKSQNVFSRAMTGGTKALEALSSPDNLSLFASLPFAPEDASTLISGVFSAQMTQGAAAGGYETVRAAYHGDYGAAAEAGAQALIGSAFAVASGKHALSDRLAAGLTPAAAEAPAPFGKNLAEAVDAAEQSKLRERSPEKFDEAMQAIHAGDPSLRIPSDQFSAYFKGKGMDPATVAQGLGSTNYTEAAISGGDVEIPPADFLSKLDPEHQKALLGDIVDPSTGLSPREHQEGLAAVQEWAAGGGAAKLAADTAAADAETAATPEYKDVKDQLTKRYTDAGETPEVAETLATKDANAYSNLARNAGMKPTELLGLYNPKVTIGEAPEGGVPATMNADRASGEPSSNARGDGIEPSVAEAPLHQKAIENIRSVVEAANEPGDKKKWTTYAPASEWLRGVAKSAGLELDGFAHGIDADAVRHAKNEHGDAQSEASRGQVAITDEDFEKIPEVVSDPDRVVFGLKTRSKSLDAIAYVKRLEDGTIAHVEEVRTGRKRLAATSMWKYPAEMNVDSIAANLHQNVRDDGGRTEPIVVRGPGADKADILHQSGPEQPRGWFRVLPDGSYEIGKTKIGDLSTFVHEPAHAYLKILGDLSKRDGASDTLKGDYQKVLDFLGAKDGEPLTREQQETWARANEQYLREGRAPSAGLKGTFQRFAIWLGSVYKKASDLGVNLSDDIRGVFDRLYAAEDGVNKAETEAGPKLFTSPEEAGWTDEQFQQYADANKMSTDQAKAEILSKLNETAVRDRTEAWRDEEKNVRTAVTADVDQRPEYSAIRSLRKGQLDDGTEITMSRDELVKQFGEERVKQLQQQHPGLYRNEGGEEPEIVAEVFGFHSAAEMMKALALAPRRSEAIDAATRDYMTAKHGDIRYDGSLNDQARIALENDQKAAVLHKQLEALNRPAPEINLKNAQRELEGYQKEQDAKDMESLANLLLKQTGKQREQIAARDQRVEELKQKIANLQKAVERQKQEEQAGKRFAKAVAPIDSYREAAHQMVEKKAVADLQPTRYLDASRKYARQAFDALAKGDYWGAKQATHMQLMNHFLFREATEAKGYVGKFEAYAKRVQKPAAQQKLGLAGSDYLEQFNRILGRYGLGAQVPAGERTLSAFAADEYAKGKEPAIDPAILNEARSIHYRSAPLAEIRQVHDALINVRQLAALELGMVVNGKRIEFSAAIGNMDAQAHESLTTKPTRVLKGNATLGEKIGDYAQRGDALLMRTERLMEWMDGGKTGPWHDNLWNLAADSQGNEYKLQEQVTKQLGDALENMPKEQRAKMLDKVTVDGISETVTRHDLVSMAMNMGNEGNLDRLQKTFIAHGWEPYAIDNIKGMLTSAEWKFVQDSWDSLKPLGQAQAELEKRLTGLPPVMVRPTPLEFRSIDNADMQLAGGYYPVVMDPRFSARGAAQDAGTTAQNMMEAGYGRAATSRGNMKERTGFGGPLQLDYEQVLTQHTAKVIKDITHREFMLAASKLLLDPQIRQTMRETLGQGYEEKMMPWLRTIVNDRNGSAVQGLGDFSQIMRSLRTNLTLATLSYKISTSLLQWTHAPRMLLSTNPGSYAQAMVDFLAHPSEMTDQIRGLSPNEMAGRGENLDRDIRAVLKGDPGIQRSVARVGNVSIKYTDHILSFPLWLSVYRDALTEHAGLAEDRAKDLAMHQADSAVRLGLGSAAPKDLPPIMRNNDLSKLLTMFYSFHNGIYGQVRDIGHQYSQSGGAGKLTYGLALSVLVPAVLGGIVSGNGPKDDENKGLWAAKRALLFGADTVPLVRDAASAIDSDGEVKNPLMNVLSKGTKATQEAMSDSDDKDWNGIGLNSLEVGGDLAGVPGTTQAVKPLRYMNQVQRGKVESPNVWDAMAGSVHK